MKVKLLSISILLLMSSSILYSADSTEDEIWSRKSRTSEQKPENALREAVDREKARIAAERRYDRHIAWASEVTAKDCDPATAANLGKGYSRWDKKTKNRFVVYNW